VRPAEICTCPQRLFHELRHALLDAHLRPQGLGDSGPLRLDARQQIQCLLHRDEAPLCRRFLAEAHKRRAHERLQILVLLDTKSQPNMAERMGQQPRVGLSVESREFRQSSHRSLSCVGFLAVGASRVVLEDADRFGSLAVHDESKDVGLHIFRRNAPSFLGKQHLTLGVVWQARPELTVQDLSVRLDQNSRFGHLVFVLAENFP